MYYGIRLQWSIVVTFLDCYTGCDALEGAVVDDAAFSVVYHVAVLCGQVCAAVLCCSCQLEAARRFLSASKGDVIGCCHVR
jgi:hypothetical protein